MFNRKLKNRIKELEMRLDVEKFSRELQEDSKAALMSALTTALTKDIITVDQHEEIFKLYGQYFDILRNYKKGA